MPSVIVYLTVGDLGTLLDRIYLIEFQHLLVFSPPGECVVMIPYYHHVTDNTQKLVLIAVV
ncbi:hypothetical protein [Cylindrospermopsis curvispora]|uniref:Uncharacterized protein n=1 Tax=Cylindrospermopsis curvispora GIHE-G1 TaxID=2666332 RepID=A0A7H0F2D9_9CYAN|nr:hypothetical protein [Cylindrospermopsis curvispora]QNP30205.1 hypothetical protein IAR63_03815 [Cylindrospermopsis curvispora GIHE-G1]